MEPVRRDSVVWVTGGAGYIGSNVVRLLKAWKMRPIIIDDFSTGTKRFLPSDVPWAGADITDFDKLDTTMQAVVAEHGSPTAVIHLAAESNVGWCQMNPDTAYKTNVIGTYNMADMAVRYGCKKFTFISSAAVYGNVGKKASDTTWDWIKPTGVYGQTKLDAERMLNAYFKNKMEIFALRLFNVAGAGFGDSINISPRGRPDPESPALFPSMVRAFLSKSAEGPIIMNEQNGMVFSHTPVRDFIHVRDVANMIVGLALTSFPRFWGTDIMIYNGGRGQPVKISDLLKLTKYDKKELIELVKWEQAPHTDIPYSVAGGFNIGGQAERTLADMWQDEVRWHKSKMYQLIKSDKSKE